MIINFRHIPLFTNNADTTITSAISDTDTSIEVSDGEMFFDDFGNDRYQIATLNEGNSYEIIAITNRSGNTLTVVRGIEGTNALSWSEGARLFSGLTAGIASLMMLNQAVGEQAIAVGPKPRTGFGSWQPEANLQSVAIGFQPAALGEESVAIGRGAYVTGNKSVGIGDGIQIDGDGSTGFGRGAYLECDNVWRVAGISAVPRNLASSEGDAPRINTAAQMILTTSNMNIRNTGSYTIQMPTDVRFFVEEVGVFFVWQQNYPAAELTQDPEVQFGTSDVHDFFVDPVTVTGMEAGQAAGLTGPRWVERNLKSYDGVHSLRFEITADADASSWGFFHVRAYWKGFAIEEFSD